MKETSGTKNSKWNKNQNPFEDSKENLKDFNVKPIRAITVEQFSKNNCEIF